MVSSSTFSSPSAVAWIAKRLTLFASIAAARNKVTDFIGGTIRVATTASLNAGNKRVALKARRTHTNRGVEINLTLGSAATDGGQARIHTLLILACFIKWTVSVNLTFIYKGI